MTLPLEQLGYLRALDGAPLYAAYHAVPERPDGAARKLPVVIAPPLFEERKSAYAALRRLALRLAEDGHAVMRFDYRGSGESGGKPEARRWEHLAQDVMSVRKTLARLTGQRDAALLGLRLGATLVLQETIRVGGEAVIALAPVIKGAAQVRQWRMRSKIRAELTAASVAEPAAENVATTNTAPGSSGSAALDFDGYAVHPAFFDDVAGIDLVRDLGRLSCRGVIVQLSHRTEAAPETAQLMDTLGPRATLTCLRAEPFWEKVDDVDTAPVEELVRKALASL
jgi:pimeloyl-ACP methyl ester carboxylesterase